MGHYDIGIIKAADSRSHLDFKEIAMYHYGIIVNPDLVTLAKSPSWASLSDIPLVIKDNRGSLRKQTQHLNMISGKDPEVTAECTSFPQVLDMVNRSACISIFPQLAKSQAKAKGCRWMGLKELQSEELSIGMA